MKIRLYLTVAVAMLVLMGCNSENETVNFIPTPKVTPIVEDNEEPLVDEDNAASPTDGEDEEITPVTKYVKLGSYGAILNIRKSPDLNGQVVGLLNHADKIEVLKVENGWASFKKGDQTYYVSDSFLVDEKPEALVPPTPTPTPIPTPEPTPTPTPTPKADQDAEEEAPTEDEEELPPEI